MTSRRQPSGAFTVTGPYEDDHPVPVVGAGMGVGVSYATKHRDKAAEITYYVRDLAGNTRAYVTKHEDGTITVHQTEGRPS